MNLKNQTVIVTGGASGLGEAVVRRFVKAGANAIKLKRKSRIIFFMIVCE